MAISQWNEIIMKIMKMNNNIILWKEINSNNNEM